MMRRSGLATGTLALAGALATATVGGCSAGDASWAGTVTDSAGIRIVTNPATRAWPDGTQPVIEEQLRIGSAGGDAAYQFGQIAGLDVGPDGSLYVLDQQAGSIRVYDPSGQFVRDIGRSGSGPGELSQAAMGLMFDQEGMLLVPDPLQQRINRFRTDGSPAGEYMMVFTEGIPMKFEQMPDGRVVQQSRVMALPGQAAGSVEPMDRLLLRGADGTLSDTLLVFASGGTIDFAGAAPRIRIFDPEPMWTIGQDGKLYYGMNTGYSIEVRSDQGRLERIIRKPFERQPVTEADQQAFRDVIREMFERQGLPPQALEGISQMITFAEQYPAFANLMRGPGNTLMVQHVRRASDAVSGGRMQDPRDMGSPTWDVFDGEGRLLGQIELPAKFTPLLVRGDDMWGVWRDDLDVQYVVRLHVTGLQTS